MSIECPNCKKQLPPLRVNVKQTATILGVSRWTAAALFHRFAWPWQPNGRKQKTALLSDIVDWIRKNSATNAQELKTLLDGRARENRSKHWTQVGA